MTTTDYVNVIETLNEKFLSSDDEGWSFNYRYYGNVHIINFNDENLWISVMNKFDYEADLDWTEESLLKFCEEQYRDYITKLYRTLEL